ncbi:MAG: hypothetical protein QW688_08335 [Thermoprotei archaeon]
MSEQTNTLPPVFNLKFDAGRWTNTIEYSLLYSLKNRKFINGRVMRGHGKGVSYRVFAGFYMLIKVSGYTDDRGVSLVAKVIQVTGDNEFNVVEKTEADLSWDEFRAIAEDPEAPNVLKQFVEARPAYHGTPSIPSASGLEGYEEIKAYFSKLRVKLAEE